MNSKEKKCTEHVQYNVHQWIGTFDQIRNPFAQQYLYFSLKNIKCSMENILGL